MTFVDATWLALGIREVDEWKRDRGNIRQGTWNWNLVGGRSQVCKTGLRMDAVTVLKHRGSWDSGHESGWA
jgi:hypothetical protein